MASETPAVVIIDDDEVFRERLCRAFQLRNWEAHAFGDGSGAMIAVRELAPDLAVVDLRLAVESGLDVVRALRVLDGTMAIFMLTGYGSIATALEAVRCGANDYLSKPVDADQIIAAFAKFCSPDSAGAQVQSGVPSLGRVEWEHIQRVLSNCGGNISQAAKLLGLHRRSLQRKLSKYAPR